MFAVVDDHLAIDQNVVYTIRSQIGLFVGGAILDSIEVKDDRVRPAAFADDTAIREAHSGSGPRCQFTNRIFKGQYMLLSDKSGDQSREITVAAWMWKTQRVVTAQRERCS